MDKGIEKIFREKIIPVSFERHINLFGATTIGVGALMGAGIYVLIGLAATKAGPSLWVSYVICGGLAFMTTLAYAEIARILPVAGGGYAYAYKMLGSIGGFSTGWYLALGSIFACALYAIGFAEYFISSFGYTVPPIASKLTAGALVVLLTLLNTKGTKGGDSIQNVLTWGNLGILLVLVLFSIPFFTAKNLTPMFPEGYSGTFGAISIIYISFFGYQLIANSSEEIKQPRRNVPQAMINAMGISFTAYLVVAVACILVIPWDALAASSAPLVLVASKSMGDYGFLLISLGGILAAASALNSTLLSQGRQIYAMGKNAFLPKWLGTIHEVTKTPRFALLTGGMLVIVSLLLFDLEFIVKSANFCLLASLLPISIALRRLYQKMPEYKPKVWWKKILPEATLLTNLLLLSSLDLISILFGIQLGIIGAVFYFVYSRKRETRSKEGMNIDLSEEKRAFLQFGSRILVPMANPTTQKAILSVSNALLKKGGGEIVALSVANTPKQMDFYSALSEADTSLELMKRTKEMQAQVDHPIRPVIRASHSISKGIVHAAEEEGCNLIIMGYSQGKKGSKQGAVLLMEEVIRDAGTDLVFFKFKDVEHGFAPKKIAVSVGSSLNLDLMVKLSGTLADHFGGEVTFLNILPEKYEAAQRHHSGRTITKALQEYSARALFHVNLIASDSPVDALVEKSADFDLLIIGTTKVGLLQKAMMGNFSTQVAERAACSVAAVRVIPTARKIFSNI